MTAIATFLGACLAILIEVFADVHPPLPIPEGPLPFNAPQIAAEGAA
ncbi:hypothetical protein LX81_00251 [Palleronia aestuarii]|uniref:Uncharacterized protein n=1 Tax=Palleronia aestuarii TaxID=568105 RepID=A0A2W7QD62_9RHOB|nr:hypothetical protein [Palleronia aestuarii]PZX19789.1 hypothetical protein LX81_00251 [Palleronia aestuarii]